MKQMIKFSKLVLRKNFLHRLIAGFLFAVLINLGTRAVADDDLDNISALLNLGTDIKQVLIVHPSATTIYKAQVTAWGKNGETWIKIFDVMPAVVGRNGMAPSNAKKEGDGRTPSGIYRLSTAFGYETHIDTKLTYRQVTANDHWVDDPKSAQYNQWIVGTPQASSFENLKRDDDLYKYAVVIEYNTAPIKPGEGSAIFLHIWRDVDSPTAGCVAIDEENIKKLLKWLNKDLHPVILLDPKSLGEMKDN